MKFPIHVLAGATLLAALTPGCGPQEPAAPAVPEKNRAETQREEFFGREIAHDPAITWRPIGMGVRVLAPGEGMAPTLGDRVRIRYTGKLKDGTVFDATPADGKPAEFTLGQMIPGMSGGISALKPGGRAILYVPPSLGYGGMKVGKIPPVSGLIFEVELIAVLP